MSIVVASETRHHEDAGGHTLLAHESINSTRGRVGMWMFLGSEVVTFGGLIGAFLLMRLGRPEWLEHSGHTLTWVGGVNTVVLLTSSLFAVLAHHCSEHNDVAGAKKWLVLTLLGALLFMCFKSYEYHHEWSNGVRPWPQSGKIDDFFKHHELFWTFYFLMTGLHGIHVLGGIIAMVVLLVIIKPEKKNVHYVIPLALYWHFVDIVWIFLFPLMYVSGHPATGGAH